MSFSALASVLLLTAMSTTGETQQQPLYVLSLLPYSDSNGAHGWDRGLELLPAARVAVKHINNRTDILPGYEMRLIERASDACGRTVITKGLLNFVGNTLKQYEHEADAIAVVGLACSTVTATVSPIAGRSDILQMALANSVFLRDTKRFPHLWRFAPSSDQLIEAVVKFIEVSGWTRIGMVSAESSYFFSALAESFRNLSKSRNLTLLFDELINPKLVTISSKSVIDRIQTMKARIILSATTLPESIELICQAAKKNILWPGYVWIFLSRSYQEFLNHSTSAAVCENIGVSLTKALENVLLLDLELSGRPNDVMLESGVTYGQYRLEYDEEYLNIQKEYEEMGIEFSSTYNVYANGMYDVIMGLALSLNQSIEELTDNGLDLAKYMFNMPEITEIIERNLKNLTFSGALNEVYFNQYNEVLSSINIFQVRNYTSQKIAIFKDNEVFRLNSTPKIEEFPQDSFETRYNFVNTGVVVELYVNAIVLFLTTTVLLCISMVLKKEPELLAVSPLLNSLMFIGCYLLIIASVLSSTQNYIKLSAHVYITICYLQSRFGQNGIYLITATLLVRLVRVYRIFTHFGKTSRFWKDKYLFVVILIISSLPSLVTLVGVIVDPLQYVNNQKYLFDENPPVGVLTPACSSYMTLTFSTISDIIDKVYALVLVLLLLTFAILTRKVNKKNFKDTKKVTAFVSCFTFIAPVTFIIVYLFQSINRDNIALVILSYSYQLMALLTLTLLIAPKALPALYYRILNKKRNFHTVTDKNATFSKTLVQSLHSIYGSSSNLNNLVVKTSTEAYLSPSPPTMATTN